MGLEKLLIFGIAAFGFMAFTQLLRTGYETKKLLRARTGRRPRRAIASEDAAAALADRLVADVCAAHPDAVRHAARTGAVSAELKRALDEVRAHFDNRVSSRHRACFHAAVTRRVFGRKEIS